MMGFKFLVVGILTTTTLIGPCLAAKGKSQASPIEANLVHHQQQQNPLYYRSVNITVSEAPKLVGILEELNIPEDSNATITCSLGSGKLEGLTYQWFKDKERLNVAENNKIRIEVPVDNYQSVLRIFDAKPTDSALYTCQASNRHGQDRITTKLNVRGESGIRLTSDTSGDDCAKHIKH